MKIRAYRKTKAKFPNDTSWGIGIFYFAATGADPWNLDCWLGRWTLNARGLIPSADPRWRSPNLKTRLIQWLNWTTWGFGFTKDDATLCFNFGPWQWTRGTP